MEYKDRIQGATKVIVQKQRINKDNKQDQKLSNKTHTLQRI